ncbi:hypothetical protein [uncultured Intestinimonas sp.]|uniref:hypothetical protein n=1 Tax=uncultured Intestinimonas sp. TaxID=1689265 RepID=UPI00261AAF82|nr:hypothetical protein [uncultured Intestinimonas sp.]
MNGQYSEKLISGGELIVSIDSWNIKYYFPGPDLRYNGIFVTVKGSEIEKYISAWKSNYSRYLLLKKSIPVDGDFCTTGEMGMSIRIGRFFEGVCLYSYHMPIKTVEKLNQVISDYQYAKERAVKLQELLHNL